MHDELITVVVGFDQREAVAYHTFCQSVIDRSSRPVRFIPLAKNTMHAYRETHSDGSNAFVYSRFLTPFLAGYSGWAIYADGDMVCDADIRELWDMQDDSKAVLVAKHAYRTKAAVKYFGNRNEDYPRKNWSSLILWNCGHAANRILAPAFVEQATGAFLHRFSWLEDSAIGELPLEWNWLDIEYEPNEKAKLIHYTLGTPCFTEYADSPMAGKWWAAYESLQQGVAVADVQRHAGTTGR